MQWESPPRKYRRGVSAGDDILNRRTSSRRDPTDLPPPPDVVGVERCTAGHKSSRHDTSYNGKDDDYHDSRTSFEEGRCRFERSEVPRMPARRSPDRYDRRAGYLDDDDDDAWDLRAREQPTDTIILKGLPDCFRERDVEDLVHGIRGVKDIRMISRRRGRDGGPMAFIEFHTIEQCITAEERWLRDRLEMERLFRVTCEFAQPLGSHRISDWVCGVCRTLNFSRREECIKCRSDRDWRGDSPSRTICVSNVDADFTEEDMKILVAEHGVAQDVRLVRSRSSTHHGIAYITFATVEDAKATKRAISGAQPSGQHQPLEIAFAQDRGAHKASIASQAVAAATAMNAYNSVGRKDTEVTTPSGEGSWKPREIPQEDSNGVAGPDASSSDAVAAAPGFVYDEASGYYYDSGSGYFYDANTQLYYHPTTQAWYRHNEATGEYDVIPAESTAPTSERSEATATDVAKQSDPAIVKGAMERGSTDFNVQGAVAHTSDLPASACASIPHAKLTAKVSKASAGQADMVSAWLQRKAEEQRKAARDFLKKPVESKSSVSTEAPATNTSLGNTINTVDAGKQVHGPVVAAEADTIVQHVAGGIVRGKVYSKRTA